MGEPPGLSEADFKPAIAGRVWHRLIDGEFESGSEIASYSAALRLDHRVRRAKDHHIRIVSIRRAHVRERKPYGG